jgi:hypothetical protein
MPSLLSEVKRSGTAIARIIALDSSMIPNRPSPAFLGALAGAAVLLLLGTMPILAGLGLLRSGDAIEPWARIIAVLFGLVFLLPGVAIVVLPLRHLASRLGAASWRASLRLGARLLWSRVNASSITAALAVAVLVVAYWTTLLGRPSPWLGREDTLEHILTVEFLVIHGFPFFVIAGSFAGFTRGAARAVAAGFLATLAIPYGFLAWKLGGGPEGLGALGYLLVPNVLAVVRPSSRPAPRITAASRWGAKFGAFVLIAATIGDGSVQGSNAVLVGAFYFSVLAIMELVRVPDLPLDLAVAWNALPGTDGQRARAVLATWRRPRH